jgi:hypothetical protein
MDFAERNRIFLKKLRDLPEHQKKIILWTIVIILALIMGTFWVRSAAYNFLKIGGEIKNVKMPEINTPNTPSLNILQTSPAKILPEQNLGGQAAPGNTK